MTRTLVASASISLLVAFALHAQAPQPADLIVTGGRIYTVDQTRPIAEAFAVKNGRFTAVGSTGDVRNLATARTPVIDAQRVPPSA